MVKAPYYDSNGIKKGAWNKEEDDRLKTFIHRYGHRNWRLVPIYAGLKRCGKSCRLRWENYLKPGLKRGDFSAQEHELIIKLHSQIGNKWSTMASYFPGRTDNDLKNYWNGHIDKSSRRNKKVSKAIHKNTSMRSNNHDEYYSSMSMNDCSNSESPPHNLTEPLPKNAISSSPEESFSAHQENLSTELPSRNRDDGHISYCWDHYREISSEAFDFGIYQEIESDKLSSFIDPISVIPSINCPGTSSDSSSCSNDGVEGNFWWESFGNGTNSINEQKIDGLSEEDYALLSYLLS